MQSKIVPLIVRLLAVVLLAGGRLVCADDYERMPDLQIRVSTNLRMTSDHTAEYLQTLYSGAKGLLGDLELWEEGDAPPLYGLLIEHKGKVSIGGLVGPKIRYGRVTSSNTPYARGSPGAERVWWVSTRQTGDITCKLFVRKGKRYATLRKWRLPVSRRQDYEAHSVVQYSDEKQTFRSPVSEEEARTDALMSVMPPDVGRCIAWNLFPMEITDVGKDGTQQYIVVSLANRSPWPVECLRARTVIRHPTRPDEKRYYDCEYPEIVFKGLLAPGRSAQLRIKADDMFVKRRRESSVEYESISFAVEPRPDRDDDQDEWEGAFDDDE